MVRWNHELGSAFTSGWLGSQAGFSGRVVLLVGLCVWVGLQAGVAVGPGWVRMLTVLPTQMCLWHDSAFR